MERPSTWGRRTSPDRWACALREDRRYRQHAEVATAPRSAEAKAEGMRFAPTVRMVARTSVFKISPRKRNSGACGADWSCRVKWSIEQSGGASPARPAGGAGPGDRQQVHRLLDALELDASSLAGRERRSGGVECFAADEHFAALGLGAAARRDVDAVPAVVTADRAGLVDVDADADLRGEAVVATVAVELALDVLRAAHRGLGRVENH